MNAITVVLPVYNEGPWLRSSLERLHAHLRELRGAYRTELIVVDDASQDSSTAVIETFRRQHPGALRFLRLGRRQGMVGALRAATEAARSSTIVVMDGKLSYPPETIEQMAGEAFRTGAACVIASAYLRGGRVSRIPLLRRLGDALANRLLSHCVRGRVATLTGLVRTYDAKVLRELLTREPEGDFNAWAIGELLGAGRILREVPAHMSWPSGRNGVPGQTSLREIWQDGLAVLRAAGRLRRLPSSTLVSAGSTSSAPVGTYGPL
jgi:glycosyltransferase involved in cell wall biosynthesis